MSTRCQIGFYEESEDTLDKPHTLLYRHCDGYPEGGGVKDDLVEFVQHFLKDRGWDIEYIGARALCYLISQHTGDLPNQRNKFGGCLTYGICRPNCWHGDIEYYYAVYPDRIEIYSVPFDADVFKFKLLEKVELTPAMR